jgi:hypothetical protein
MLPISFPSAARGLNPMPCRSPIERVLLNPSEAPTQERQSIVVEQLKRQPESATVHHSVEEQVIRTGAKSRSEERLAFS